MPKVCPENGNEQTKNKMGSLGRNRNGFQINPFKFWRLQLGRIGWICFQKEFSNLYQFPSPKIFPTTPACTDDRSTSPNGRPQTIAHNPGQMRDPRSFGCKTDLTARVADNPVPGPGQGTCKKGLWYARGWGRSLPRRYGLRSLLREGTDSRARIR